MATPPPPPSGGGTPPSVAGGQLFGSANLSRALDALTRQFGVFTNRFLSQAGLSPMTSMGFGPTGGRGSASAFGSTSNQLHRQMVAAQQTFQDYRDRDAEARRLQTERWQHQQQTLADQLARSRSLSQSASVQRRMDISNTYQDQFISQSDRGLAAATRTYSDRRDQLVVQRQQLQAQTVRTTAGLAGVAVGSIVGAAKSYYSGGFEEQLGQYGRRLSMMDPQAGISAGRRAQNAGTVLRNTGAFNWTTGNEDLFGGSMAIMQQTAPTFRDLQLQRAATAAFITPGLGMQGAAQMQAELGTARAFYASQMYGLTPTRLPGGAQTSSIGMGVSIANRVNMGNFANLSKNQLLAEFAQGGSLAISMQNYAQSAGLSGQSVDAMRQQTEVMRDLMNPAKRGQKKLTQQQAEDLLSAATKNTSAGDKARQTMKNYGIDVGSSYQDAQNLLAGESREGHLGGSATFLDAAKKSADTLTDIYRLLNQVLGPFKDTIGTVSGALKGGGLLGSATQGNLISSVSHHGFWGGVGDWFAGIGKGAWSGLKSGWNMGMPSGLRIGGASGPPGTQNQAPPSGGGNSGLPSGNVQSVIDAAMAERGKPYELPPHPPATWDCSSLVQMAYSKIGVNLPRTSQEQIKSGVGVSLDQVQPGDLLFYGDGSHVTMAIGGGQVVEAPHTGDVVKVERIADDPRLTVARRVVGGGSGGALTNSLSGKSPAATGGPASGGFGGAGNYGSISEVDALAAALAGGGGGADSPQQSTRNDRSTQNQTSGNAGDYSWGPIKGSQGTIPAPPDAVKNAILAAMGITGVSGGAWARGLTTIAYRESTYNAGSVNNSDANAMAGTPSEGLMQIIGPTFEEYRVKSLPDDLRNSEANVAAAINYIKKTYGGIEHVQQANPDMPSKGYAGGISEVVGDQLVKLHGGEMVLTANQAAAARKAAVAGSAPSQGTVNLQFGSGSVVIQMPSASSEGAKTAAKSFVDFVAADERVKSLMAGW